MSPWLPPSPARKVTPATLRSASLTVAADLLLYDLLGHHVHGLRRVEDRRRQPRQAGIGGRVAARTRFPAARCWQWPQGQGPAVPAAWSMHSATAAGRAAGCPRPIRSEAPPCSAWQYRLRAAARVVALAHSDVPPGTARRPADRWSPARLQNRPDCSDRTALLPSSLRPWRGSPAGCHVLLSATLHAPIARITLEYFYFTFVFGIYR